MEFAMRGATLRCLAMSVSLSESDFLRFSIDF